MRVPTLDPRPLIRWLILRRVRAGHGQLTDSHLMRPGQDRPKASNSPTSASFAFPGSLAKLANPPGIAARTGGNLETRDERIPS